MSAEMVRLSLVVTRIMTRRPEGGVQNHTEKNDSSIHRELRDPGFIDGIEHPPRPDDTIKWDLLTTMPATMISNLVPKQFL